MDSYMASNRSCFTITWIVFKNHFSEVGLSQNRETMALRPLTTVGWLCYTMCEDPREYKLNEIAFVLRARSHMPSHHTWRSMTTLHAFGGALERPLDTHLLLGCHNSMVTALGSCVKWPSTRTWSIKILAGVVTPPRRMENGGWGKKRANRIASPWRKVWHPNCGAWRMGFTCELACGKNVCFVHTLGSLWCV